MVAKERDVIMTKTKHYRTIVIDPPWPVSNSPKTLKLRRSSLKGLPYNSMTIDQILAFPINDFAHEESSLFLWHTFSMLPHALDIMKSWKFKYYCQITWFKNTGVGLNGVYCDTESCLYGYRGKMNTRVKSLIRTHVTAPVTKHSEKPRTFYHMLIKSTPAPRIDIFGRRHHYGFDAWGDQVEADNQQRLCAT